MTPVARVLAVLSVICPAPVTLTAEEVTLRDLPVAVTAAALDPETGNVAIAGASENQVWLLPSGWFDDPRVRPIGPLATPTNPVSMLFKRYQNRSYLVVACFDGQGIIVLDATTRKVVADIPPTPASPKVLVSASDNRQDPWIYVTGATGNGLRLDAFRIDTPQPILGEINARTQVSLAFKPSSGGYFVSSNGRSLYGVDRDRQTITRWSVQSPTIATEFPTTKYVTRAITLFSNEPLIRLPLEQGFAQGSSYRLANLQLSPSQLPLRAACAIGSRPLIIGLTDGGDWQVASLVTGKLVARVQCPRELDFDTERTISLRSGAQVHRLSVRPIVLADETRDRIIFLAERRAYATALAPLNLPDEPILTAVVDLPASVTVEEEVVIEVNPSDSRVKVELSSAPSGMRFVDGRLRWKPAFAQRGQARFSLQVSYDEATRKQDHAIEVTSHTAPSPFPATHAKLADAGERLVVWASSPPHQIGVLDLATRDTVAVRALPSSIIAAALSGDTICVLTSSKNEAFLALLDSKTLETKLQRTLKVTSTVRYLENSAIAITAKTVSIHAPSGIVQHYSRVDLQPLSEAAANETNADDSQILKDLRAFIRPAPQPLQQAARKSEAASSPQHARVTFHPRELQQSAADYKQRHAPLQCDAISVRLGIQLVTESIPGFTRIDLVARAFQSDQVIHRWPVDLIETAKQTRDLDIFWSVSGSRVVLLFGGRLYVKDLTAVSALDLPRPFRLQPADIPSLAKWDGKTRLHYSLSGGEPPYALVVNLREASGTTRQPAWTTSVPDTLGEFDADIAGYVKDQLAKIAHSLIAWSPETASADAIMQSYVDSVVLQFESLTGQQPVGVPVAIPVVVAARDAQGQTQQLSHYLLADLPRELLELEANAAVAKRWAGTVVAKAAEDHVVARLGPQSSSDVIRFSQGLRRGAAPVPPTRKQLESAAQQALAKLEQRWQQVLLKELGGTNQHPLRKWSDKDGNTFEARFEDFFAGQVIVTLEEGTMRAFAVENLSAADQAYVRQVTTPADPEQQLLRHAPFVQAAKLRHIALAAHNFHDTYRHLPPPAFVDEAGRAVLSWRVMLLPFLGGEELYRLFRFEEPWDSDHNLLLASYMPSIYITADAAADRTRTSIVRPVGRQTVATLDQQISFRDIRDGTANTLFATLVHNEHAVVWTKPADLAVDEQGAFSGQLWWRDEKTLAVMCDAKVRSIRRTTSPAAWFNAVTRNDGHSSKLETE